MGADGIGDPDLAAISPAKLADQADIPVLLIHGKDDTVVRYDQSQTMADALKKAGKPYQFVTLDGEDHWLSRGATRGPFNPVRDCGRSCSLRNGPRLSLRSAGEEI